MIIAWLADTCVDYHNQHPGKLEFQLLAQMVFLGRTYVESTRACVLIIMMKVKVVYL